jgi:WD40 repeat protein
VELAKPLFGTDTTFDRAVILLDDVIQILHWPVPAPSSHNAFLLNGGDCGSVDGSQIGVDDTPNSAAHGIYCTPSDGSGTAQRLTEGAEGEWPASFSPDGSHLAINGEGKNVAILLAHLEGGLSLPRVIKLERISDTGHIEASPAISPDGRLLAYNSNETGRFEVYVRPFPGGGDTWAGKWQVSTGGGRLPVWSTEWQGTVLRLSGVALNEFPLHHRGAILRPFASGGMDRDSFGQRRSLLQLRRGAGWQACGCNGGCRDSGFPFQPGERFTLADF